jgi:hypothetical protein
MKIQRYGDYNLQYEMAGEFLKSFDEMVKESDGGTSYEKVAKKVISDLKLNFSLVGTFGAGIGALYPVVHGLMTNMSLDSFNLTPESIVLLTLASVTITYLEEKKFKSSEEEEELTKDSKSMLEELKMKGFGNGIVKKLMKGLKSIKNIFSIIGKHLGAVIGSVIDMFAYTSILIPILNGVMFIINKYDLNLDTLPQNFLGLAMGIGTIIAKHGIVEIINRIKNRFPINTREVLNDIETPAIQRFANFGDGDVEDQDGDLIKEQ